ncbi:sensor histidine kinase [Aliikangiella sp. IMCC44653]
MTIISDFEREFTLQELLPATSLKRIESSLEQFNINNYQLVDSTGKVYLTKGEAVSEVEIDLCPELDPVGTLCVAAENEQAARALSALVLDIMQTNWRYQMSSDLHIQTTQDDYKALLEKTNALEISERKYKNLAESLEEKVQLQVAQIEQSQKQLYEAEKMASVGQLAAGVAHEINNPIGFVKSNLTTASEYVTDLKSYIAECIKYISAEDLAKIDSSDIDFVLEDFSDLMQQCIDGTKRVSNIVKDLKAFSEVDHSEQLYIDLSEHLESVGRIFNSSTSENIQFQVKIEPLLPTYCKPNHINQLLLNLLNNAANAIEGKGSVLLSAKMLDNKIELSVSDNGKGMDEETQRKAFEPFFTTEEVGSGTGLGLTVCRDIVKAHQGEIVIKSKPNVGTKVSVIIPVKQSE